MIEFACVYDGKHSKLIPRQLATGFAIAWAVARYQESCSWAK